MEPVGALASVTADGCEVWCGSQWSTNAVELAAKTAGVAPEKVKFNLLSIGGGFGRRIFNDYVVDAVALSKAVSKPVKMVLTREDDFANARLRPMTAHRIEAGLDASGKVTAVRHRIAADTVVPYIYSPQRMEAQKGVDHVVFAGADMLYYDVANHTAEHIYQEHGVRVGAWRGIGAGANAFAIEAMIDELAVAAGKDPYDFRLALLKNERAKKVVETVAKLADWPRKRAAGTGLGIAFARLGLPIPPVGESMSATVAEVTVNRETGRIRVSNLWCAVDVGLPVQPKNIAAQVEGSLVWGLSAALKERITIKGGRVEQQNYPDYDVMRMSDMPAIQIEIIRSGDVPLPVGELGLATVNPAVAGAFFAATGKRIRNAPFLAGRVRDALKG
jgi:isoquinoline 1-oxidoreductase subunit beta